LVKLRKRNLSGASGLPQCRRSRHSRRRRSAAKCRLRKDYRDVLQLPRLLVARHFRLSVRRQSGLQPRSRPGLHYRNAPACTILTLRPGKASHAGFQSSKCLTPVTRFIRCTFGKIRTDDHLGDQAIGAGRQTISNASIHVEAPDLEIDHAINIVLLLVEGQPALQRSKIGIILDPDRQILAEIAREARGRHKWSERSRRARRALRRWFGPAGLTMRRSRTPKTSDKPRRTLVDPIFAANERGKRFTLRFVFGTVTEDARHLERIRLSHDREQTRKWRGCCQNSGTRNRGQLLSWRCRVIVLSHFAKGLACSDMRRCCCCCYHGPPPRKSTSCYTFSQWEKLQDDDRAPARGGGTCNAPVSQRAPWGV